MPVPKEIGHQVKFGKSLVGLFKQACWEIPEIIGSSFMALIGISLAAYGGYRYQKNDGDNREFKSTFVLVRPDNPRAKLLKNPVYTQYK